MKRIQRLIGAMSVLASSLAAGSAGAQETGNVGRGLALAQRICSECHAVEKGQARSPNPASPRFEAIANTPGMTAIALSAALLTPHRTMPNILLNADELSNVVAYILSLRRAD